MFKQVYRRPLDGKPSCRRHRFPQAVFWSDRQPLLADVCVCHLVPGLRVEVWECPRCDLDWLLHERSVLVCPIPTKATRESLDTSSGSSVQRSSTFDSFPEIWAFLTLTVAPDGSKRIPGTLSLSFGGGVWTLALTDPTTGLYCPLSSQVIDDLVLMVEARLAEGTIPWKVSKYPPKGNRK